MAEHGRIDGLAGWRARRLAGERGEELVLGQRRIYILPTAAGVGFGALLLILLIGSVNYSLGLGYALTFLALSCALVDMLFTWRNLAQLRLKSGRAPTVFAGQEALFELQFFNDARHTRYAVQVDIAGELEGEPRHTVDVPAGAGTSVRLALPTETRGWLDAPRLTLSTRFPLGLFRAWSYWQPSMRALVYPFPEEGAPPLPASSSQGTTGSGQAGQDDFAGVRPYQAGDSLRRLAWRQMARLDPLDGGQLATKHFEGGARSELVLDLAQLPVQLDLELRLSRLTRWVLDCEQRALPYAFHAGATRLDSSLGAAHQTACLRVLALYGGGGR